MTARLTQSAGALALLWLAAGTPLFASDGVPVPVDTEQPVVVGADDDTADALAPDDGTTAEEETCFPAVPPLVRMDIPSRYKADSKNRSDFDAEANAAVEAALKPVDAFISNLVRAANKALTASAPPEVTTPPTPVDPEEAAAAAETALVAADCVVDRIAEWATADALSGLDSQGANLSAPSRIGGIAMAYAQVRALSTPDDRQPAIEAWLAARTRVTMTFFDTEAPPKSSQNNLRAWAALSAAQVGVLLDDAEILDWASASISLVACTANADGSLPNEMWRGKLALHYQIHATAPLVVGAAVLATARPGLFEVCDAAIPRIARFTIAATQDPTLVEARAEAKQTFNADPTKLKPHEFAWIAAYLTQIDDPEIATFGAQFKVLGNSKLGGKQSLIWQE